MERNENKTDSCSYGQQEARSSLENHEQGQAEGYGILYYFQLIIAFHHCSTYFRAVS
jgi:hypothetical protein